ncbi:CASP-like protein [Hibiscus syriacus]|uniref:CASP-like protein n=1 Tax=Hibiscus syriacus TaxID=106335 RepID=A0A6A2YB88_HIBSY|nr:CASP-like protein [Hibiscus syriacus]
MKISGLFAASMAAASASAALISASSSSPSPLTCNSNFQFSREKEKGQENPTTKKSTLTEKFAPRFDGLRFIETLITAHR